MGQQLEDVHDYSLQLGLCEKEEDRHCSSRTMFAEMLAHSGLIWIRYLEC